MPDERDNRDRDERLWTYSGSTAKRKKRIHWIEPPKPVSRQPLRRRNQPFVDHRATSREYLGLVVAGLVAGAFLLILAQFSGWLAFGLAMILVLLGFWELRRITRRKPSS